MSKNQNKLNLNQCHHPLITYLTRVDRFHIYTWKNLEGYFRSLLPHGFRHPCHVIRVHLHSPNLCCCRCLSGYSRNSSGFDSNCTSLLPACLKIEQILETKSLHISHAVSNYYGTEMEIWAGFGPIGKTEKKIWADYEQLLRTVFLCFHGQKQNLKYFKNHCSVRTKKLHKMKVKKYFFFLKNSIMHFK